MKEIESHKKTQSVLVLKQWLEKDEPNSRSRFGIQTEAKGDESEAQNLTLAPINHVVLKRPLPREWAKISSKKGDN